MKKSIVVIGSTNTDMVIKADHLPVPGETILGGNFFMNAGGKGANQAVAAARLGGDVTFIAKTGTDIFGKQSIELFKQEGINTEFIIEDAKHPSGIALITVDKHAENCIVVASGANAALHPSDLKNAEQKMINASIILMQLEIPLETIIAAATFASSHNIKIILNPAPACALDNEIIKNISIITPNEKEAEMLTGVKVHDVESTIDAAKKLHEKGIETVIITLGSQGALVLNNDMIELITAPKVEAVDTTAAGDVFNGALAVALAENKSITEAVKFACNAAAISVTRLGAQASVPYRNEINY